jgi:hypothetical protein
MMRHLSAISLLLWSGAALAQPGLQTFPPENADQGPIPVLTLTAQGPGTVNSANRLNSDKGGVTCVYNQASHTGSPSTTWSIQGFDAATQSWLTYITSASIDGTDATPGVAQSVLSVFRGIQTTSLPASMAAIGFHLPRTYRVQVVATAGTITARVGCVLLK